MIGNRNCFPLGDKNISLGVRLLAHGENMSPHGDFKGTSPIKLHYKIHSHYNNLLTITKRVVRSSSFISWHIAYIFIPYPPRTLKVLLSALEHMFESNSDYRNL